MCSRFIIATALQLCLPVPVKAAAESITIRVADAATGKTLPCRIHLHDASGEAVRGDGLPFWRDHFVCPGSVTLSLEAGRYHYEIERGPEYRPATGTLRVTGNGRRDVEIALERIVHMAGQGWWSGDLHVHRSPEELALHLRAEDLHVAPVITWWNNRNLWQDRALPETPLVRVDGDRYYHLMAGEDERAGGALMYYQLPGPLPITGASREYPSPMRFLDQAHRHEGVHADIEKPFWWDVPVWLAGGKVHTIGLANNHMCRSQMYENEAWGKPRDAKRFPPPLGNGQWTQEIYYQILNSGLRIPPSAGSASGVLPNPVGYNRVYVYVDGELTYEKWWEGLRAGRSFVSNGPLLRVRAGDQWPGHVFVASQGKVLDLALQYALDCNDPIAALEVIKNGMVERTLVADEVRSSGTLGTIAFDESGWFLVRAITENKKTFRFASTAPFYVEIGPQKQRISGAAAQFFLDWVRERIGRIKLDDAAQREAVLGYHRTAEMFWRNRVATANVE